MFQSTPPREGRRQHLRCGFRLVCFNPRPRARGDLIDAIPFPVAGFNPRPRARGDTTLPMIYGLNFVVSIHAPARGATLSAGSPC